MAEKSDGGDGTHWRPRLQNIIIMYTDKWTRGVCNVRTLDIIILLLNIILLAPRLPASEEIHAGVKITD